MRLDELLRRRRLVPDARAMGYPFDKSFPGDDPLATISAHRTMTVRDLTIRCADPHP